MFSLQLLLAGTLLLAEPFLIALYERFSGSAPAIAACGIAWGGFLLFYMIAATHFFRSHSVPVWYFAAAGFAAGLFGCWIAACAALKFPDYILSTLFKRELPFHGGEFLFLFPFLWSCFGVLLPLYPAWKRKRALLPLGFAALAGIFFYYFLVMTLGMISNTMKYFSCGGSSDVNSPGWGYAGCFLCGVLTLLSAMAMILLNAKLYGTLSGTPFRRMFPKAARILWIGFAGILSVIYIAACVTNVQAKNTQKKLENALGAKLDSEGAPRLYYGNLTPDKQPFVELKDAMLQLPAISGRFIVRFQEAELLELEAFYAVSGAQIEVGETFLRAIPVVAEVNPEQPFNYDFSDAEFRLAMLLHSRMALALMRNNPVEALRLWKQNWELLEKQGAEISFQSPHRFAGMADGYIDRTEELLSLRILDREELLALIGRIELWQRQFPALRERMVYHRAFYLPLGLKFVDGLNEDAPYLFSEAVMPYSVLRCCRKVDDTMRGCLDFLNGSPPLKELSLSCDFMARSEALKTAAEAELFRLEHGSFPAGLPIGQVMVDTRLRTMAPNEGCGLRSGEKVSCRALRIGEGKSSVLILPP